MSGAVEVFVASVLGQDVRFWVTVCVAGFVKTMFSPRVMNKRDTVAGIATGVATAYYGWEPVMRRFDTLTMADRDLVIIGLVISGEHIMRALATYGPGRLNRIVKGDPNK